MKTFLNVGKYQSLIMFAIVAVVCTVCALNGPEHVTGLLVAAPVSLISFAKQEKDMTDEEATALLRLASMRKNLFWAVSS